MTKKNEFFETSIASLSDNLKSALRALKVRADSSQALVRSQSETELIHAVCHIITESGNYPMTWIGYVDENSEDKLVRVVAGAGVDLNYIKGLRLGWGDGERGRSLVGQSIRSKKPAVGRGLSQDPALEAWRLEDAKKRGYSSGLILPLISGDQILGILAINSTAPDAFDDAEMDLLEALADDLAYGISAHRERKARRKAEKAYRNARRVLLTMINNIPDTIFYKDANLRYIFVNQAKIDQASSYSPVELIGNSVWDVYPKDRAQLFNEEDQITMESPEGITSWEEKIENPDGSIHWRLNTKVAVRGPDGKSEGLITIGRDITAQKNNEEILRKSLTEKETLLKELRHRVKNNLNLILSFLNLGMNEVDSPQCLNVFTKTKNRLRSVVTLYSYLDHSDRLSDVALKDYIQDLSKALMTSFQDESKRIKLDLQLADLTIDTQRIIPLGLILNELLTNSLKYAFPHETQGKISISLEVQDQEAILSVEDDGIGLPEDLDTEASPQMGIMLTKLLARQIEGEIFFSSKAGQGTQIRLRFPR